MSPLTTIAIDGVPVEDAGLGLCGLGQWHDVTTRTYPTAQQPLRQGLRPVGSGSATEVRALDLRLLVSPTSVTDRQTKLDTLSDRFAGQVEVASADAPNRVCFGLLETMRVTSPWKPFVNMSVYADARIVCHDPLWYDRDPQILWVATGTRVALPMGTGTVRRMVITAHGAATNPVFILRDQTGTEAQRMTLTGAPSSSQWVDADCDRYALTLQSAGTDLFAAGWLSVTETFLELRRPYSYTIECAQANLTVALYRSYVS